MNIKTIVDNNELIKAKEIVSNLIKKDASFAKIGAPLVESIDKKVKVNTEVTESYTAPRRVPYALFEDELPERIKHTRGRKTWVYIDHGEYYLLSEMCRRYTNVSYIMAYNRIQSGWDMLRVFGVENHKNDHYIPENLELMKD